AYACRDPRDARHVAGTGEAEVDRKREPQAAGVVDPARGGGRVEAELRGHVVGVRLLGEEREPERIGGDRRMALRVPGDADRLEPVTKLLDRPKERERVGEQPDVLTVAADHEDPPEA